MRFGNLKQNKVNIIVQEMDTWIRIVTFSFYLSMSSFILYLIGTFVLLAGLVTAAIHLKVATIWIIIGSLILVGIGIMNGTSKTRKKDASNE